LWYEQQLGGGPIRNSAPDFCEYTQNLGGPDTMKSCLDYSCGKSNNLKAPSAAGVDA
jgi:hypothetical protein